MGYNNVSFNPYPYARYDKRVVAIIEHQPPNKKKYTWEEALKMIQEAREKKTLEQNEEERI